jgi:type I restriction enzyme S subunit
VKWREYPRFKDSGVEWLGEVPEDWDTKRLKYCAQIINEKVEGKDCDLPYIGLEHIESWTGKRFVTTEPSSSEGQSNRIRLGDVLFGKLRPYLAKVHRASEEGICTGELLVLKPRCVVQGFLFYYMLSKDFISVVDSSTYGAKMPRASWEFIGNLPTLVPSQDEQGAIAAFLDRETGRIDALMEKKQRQIELLQEKRAALISHAVTKGLDSTVPLKDSGVEWPGQIPMHWDLFQLRRVINKFVDYRGATPAKSESGIPLITAKNIKNGIIDFELSKEFIREEDYDSWMVRGLPENGDVLITTEAPLGESAMISETKIALAQRIILLKTDKKLMTNEYLNYYFSSHPGKLELSSRATGSTAIGIKASKLKEILVLVPSVSDQALINNYLYQETVKIDALIAKVQESIDRLKEYRTGLISAAVTGQIDVREAGTKTKLQSKNHEDLCHSERSAAK